MIFRHLTGFLRKHGRISKGALERSSSTNSRDFRIIVTLDPKKFAEKKQQRVHIEDMSSFKTYTTIHNQSRPVNEDVIASSLYHDHDRFGDSGKQPEGSWSYPLSVKGFLYYFTKPDKPPLSGELRMRVTSSDDPASFESGSDFKKPNGQPWSRPLFVVSRSYTPLYEKLREERLVPDDLDAVLPTLHRRSPKGQFLYTLNDTFFVDFGADTYYITVLTEQGIEVLKVIGLFSEHRISDGKRQPYIGSSLVRFERSTLPDHEGTRTVVLRFLKIIAPVKCVIVPHYDGRIMPPKEGDLYRRYRKAIDKSNPPAWSLDIDKKSALSRALQLLWDA